MSKQVHMWRCSFSDRNWIFCMISNHCMINCKSWFLLCIIGFVQNSNYADCAIKHWYISALVASFKPSASCLMPMQMLHFLFLPFPLQNLWVNIYFFFPSSLLHNPRVKCSCRLLYIIRVSKTQAGERAWWRFFTCSRSDNPFVILVRL